MMIPKILVYHDMMLDMHIQSAECLLKLCLGCDRCDLNPTPTTHSPSHGVYQQQSTEERLKNFAQQLNSKPRRTCKKAERQTKRNDSAEAKEAAEKRRQAVFTSLTAPPAPVIF